MNRLPAVLVGGPPHVGKSVLTYNITRALRKQNIPHYVLRANPDGEGDWMQEAHQDTIRQIYIKGKWTDELIRLVCRDLERRLLPLLVDLGGLPTEKENCIFQACTHSLLLLPDGNSEAADLWRNLTAAHRLSPVAELSSKLEGVPIIAELQPFLKGTITGLIRRTTVQNPVFDELIGRVATLFSFYTPAQLEAFHLDIAPTGNMVNLNRSLETLGSGSKDRTPEILKHLLATLPENKALAVYGRGPNWLYGALAMHAETQSFYQFDARLGWVVPPPLQIGIPDESLMDVKVDPYEAINVLTARSVHQYLDYSEASCLQFPVVEVDKGLIISGKLPHWLVTALVRLYAQTGAGWIACFQPQLKGAVVVISHTPAYAPGDFISFLPSNL